MQGIICMWHGLIVDIPNGWALCDGSNGTPDLRDRFVTGAPDGIDPGDIGGASSHRHGIVTDTEFEDLSHSHDYDGQTGLPNPDSSDVTDVGGDRMKYDIHHHNYYGNTESVDLDHDHHIEYLTPFTTWMPPYYKILFIMKL